MHGHADVVTFLLENGANTELCDDWNCTALHNAAGAGHYQIVDLLCDAGARLDARASNKGNLVHKIPWILELWVPHSTIINNIEAVMEIYSVTGVIQ